MCSSETIFEFFTAVFFWHIIQVNPNSFKSLFFQNCLKPVVADNFVVVLHVLVWAVCIQFSQGQQNCDSNGSIYFDDGHKHSVRRHW